MISISTQRRLASLVAHPGNNLGLLDVYSSMRRHIAQLQAVIFTYHRVSETDNAPWSIPAVKPRDFENQMKYLCQAYNILSLDALVRHIQQGDCLPNKAAIITFDDGYRDNFLYAYPILRKYNIPATINLSTGNIEASTLFWWDKVSFIIWNTKLRRIDLGELGIYRLHSDKERRKAATRINSQLNRLPEEKKNQIIEELTTTSGVDIPGDLGEGFILSWDEVREMSHNGITFGAHSLTHPNLTKSPPEQARYEIVQSKRDIEERVGQDVTTFCYPSGEFNSDIAGFVKEAGFDCALTTNPRMVTTKANLYELGRIPGGWNLDTLKLFSSGLYSDANTLLWRIIGGS